MGQVVDTVLAEPLSAEAETGGPLSDGQFGSRKQWSAINPVLIIVERANVAWTNGLITGMLLIDICLAFSNMAMEG